MTMVRLSAVDVNGIYNAWMARPIKEFYSDLEFLTANPPPDVLEQGQRKEVYGNFIIELARQKERGPIEEEYHKKGNAQGFHPGTTIGGINVNVAGNAWSRTVMIDGTFPSIVYEFSANMLGSIFRKIGI